MRKWAVENFLRKNTILNEWSDIFVFVHIFVGWTKFSRKRLIRIWKPYYICKNALEYLDFTVYIAEYMWLLLFFTYYNASVHLGLYIDEYMWLLLFLTYCSATGYLGCTLYIDEYTWLQLFLTYYSVLAYLGCTAYIEEYMWVWLLVFLTYYSVSAYLGCT